MIESISGSVLAVEPAAVIVDVAGLGFRVEVTPQVAEKVGPPGSRASLLAQLVVVQDQPPRLFGFDTAEARALFRLLTSVAGIGPSTGLRIMAGHADAASLSAAIARGDDEALKVKGVGPKLAKRLVTELKDKVGGLAEAAAWSSGAYARPAASVDRAVEEAFLALRTLEFEPEEARRLLKDARATLPHATTEELVRTVLQRI
ncbi:MAG: Holliday junction branch migration protein RuvA [Planctomycetes bacterium]|nr:Holliday junction branch migration protein RuvA [Planctomycetota bacterium]